MTEKRVIRKLKKLASRINSKIESVRDEMDDLEIEFELLQQHIAKLEGKARQTTTNTDEVTVVLEDDDEEDGTTERHSQHDRVAYSLVRRNGVYYIQSPEKVQAFMKVERYRARWPLIPEEHLHASSVQHPRYSQVGDNRSAWPLAWLLKLTYQRC